MVGSLNFSICLGGEGLIEVSYMQLPQIALEDILLKGIGFTNKKYNIVEIRVWLTDIFCA